MAIRILIADDHGVMRAGLQAVLQDKPGLEVVGEAASGEEALHLVGELSPDIVLLDIAMPGIDGIEATRKIRLVYPRVRILILTVYEEESLLIEAMRAGASGYIVKRAAEAELFSAIQAVSRGEMYVHPAITRFLLKNLSPDVKPSTDAFDQLTPRELEVMGYIVRGYTNRQIAEELVISTRTVEGHRASLLSKLGLKNRVELIEYAERKGLIDG